MLHPALLGRVLNGGTPARCGQGEDDATRLIGQDDDEWWATLPLWAR